jgi:hypothetical protein
LFHFFIGCRQFSGTLFNALLKFIMGFLQRRLCPLAFVDFS